MTTTIRTPRLNMTIDECFAVVKPGTLLQPTDFMDALDLCSALSKLLGSMLAEDGAGAVITLFEESGQPISWLGMNIKDGPDPAWDRLCIANLSADGTYDPDMLLNSQQGPWVILACRHPAGSLKHNLAPIFERIYRVERKDSPTKGFQVGDIVEPVPGSGTWLRSGASQYPCAVVILAKPLMLVSIETDMLWSATVEDMKLQVCGRATPEQLAACMKRKSG